MSDDSQQPSMATQNAQATGGFVREGAPVFLDRPCSTVPHHIVKQLEPQLAMMRLRDAWTQEGRNPTYHKWAKVQLRKYWPKLYGALVSLFGE